MVRNGAVQSRVITPGQRGSISALAVTTCPLGGSRTAGSRSTGAVPIQSCSPVQPLDGVPPSPPLRRGTRPDIA